MPPLKRLPEDVVPSSYRVCLKPDLINLTFQGWETVDVLVKSPTQSIVLNAFDITVQRASLSEKDAEDTKRTAEVTYDSQAQTLSFEFSEIIQPGDYALSIEFTGHLNDQLRGFYRNEYSTPEGHTRYAAVTHFEATGARRAYPCWDEPGVKATFHFTLVAPTDRVAISNMPVAEEKQSEEDPTCKVVRFQRTPVMSTYLTAFVVGEYDFVEATTATNGTKVRVYTPLGKADHGKFALEFATKALSYYEDYFKIPYGLPKLDLITLTEFPIGAMENWGLVTYREIALLIDPSKSSVSAREYVALIVAHELSHNWFGNLVTMRWWSDLWLKEGFATWIEYLCVDALMPELHIWSRFIKMEQYTALAQDALLNSHPVQVEVEDPGQIDEIFDAISYCKGACLIRMLESHIGSEAFQSGMHQYLSRHNFSNTETTDLWKAMSEVTGQDVQQLMESWTLQMGFPIIRVKEEQLPGNIRRVTLTQENCASQKHTKDENDVVPNSYLWKVPISIVSSTSPTVPVVKELMDADSLVVTLTDCQPDHWIKVNPSQSMFYHVHYSMESLQRLLPAIQGQILSPEDRIGLLVDLLALCKADLMKVTDVLEVTHSFRSDPDFSVCDMFAKMLSSLGPVMETVAAGRGLDNTYHKFVCDSLRSTGDRVGWEVVESEEETSIMLRESILTYLGTNGEVKVKQEAFKRFQAHVSGEKPLPSDLKTPVYNTVLSHGDDEVYDQVMKIYNQDMSLEDTSKIQRCLGRMQHRMEDVLKFSLSESVRHQDSIWVMSGVRHCVKGRRLLCQFVMDNWPELYQRYGSSTLLKRLVETTMSGVCNEEMASTLQEFFKSRDTKAATRAIQQGLERIHSNATLIQSQQDDIAAFLKSYKASQ